MLRINRRSASNRLALNISADNVYRLPSQVGINAFHGQRTPAFEGCEVVHVYVCDAYAPLVSR